MYGLTYLYRASDFFEVAEKFQPESVLFTAYWCQLDQLHLADSYEFAFMGAFGMGYKLLVLGKERVASCVEDEGLEGRHVVGCSNRDLWAVASEVRGHALKVWRRIRKDRSFPSNQARSRDFVLRPGFLCRLDLVEIAFVDIDTFLEGKIPERVPVIYRPIGEAANIKDKKV